MTPEKLHYRPCSACGCRDYSVHSEDTRIQIICTRCGKSAAEGYATSAWDLLRRMELREHSDEEVLKQLEFWEQTLAEAREKNFKLDAIISHQAEVNELQGEILRRGITDKMLQWQKDKTKREKDKKRRYRFENRIKR